MEIHFSQSRRLTTRPPLSNHDISTKAKTQCRLGSCPLIFRLVARVEDGESTAEADECWIVRF
jgi:hypothetical protein